MENEETEFKALFAKYLVWKDSQQSQTDGYEYERSFIEFTRSMNKELFEMLVKMGVLPQKPEKKSPDQFR